MKRITRSLIIALMAICGLSWQANAQDVGVKQISQPADGSTLGIGFTYPFTVTLHNYSSTTLASGTKIPISFKFGNNAPANLSLTLNQAVAGGADFSVPPLTFTPPISITPGPYSISVWTALAGDVDNSNDTATNHYNVYLPQRDAGISAINSPAAGSALTPGSKVTINFDLKNFGDSAFNAGQIIPTRIIVNNTDTITFSNGGLPLQNGIQPGATATFNGTFTLPSNVPTNFDICIETFWVINNNNGNNKTCQSYNKGSGISEMLPLGYVHVFPNPFNTSTKIEYSLQNSGFVSLKVYDLTGKVVATLVNGNQASGKHEVNFDKNNLKAGTYLYRLTTAKAVKTGKLDIR